MATVMNKTKVLCVEEKFKLTRQIHNGKKKADVYPEFGPVISTIQTIWENRTKTVSAFAENGSRIKRFGKPERNDVKEALFKSFKEQRSGTVTIRRPFPVIFFFLIFNFKLRYFLT
jgi:hypothetical protein